VNLAILAAIELVAWLCEVSVQRPHTKLITAAARDVLRPMGIVQKGRSRSWYDDHGWWAGLIEFQPSGFRRGTYLNVGVQWLWDTAWDSLAAFMYPEDFYVRVEIPGAGQFTEYESDEQFAPLALKIAKVAAKRASQLRELFPNVQAAAKELAKSKSVDWDIDAGIAAGLIGDHRSAGRRFDHYLAYDASEKGQKWRSATDDIRSERVRALRACVDDTERFKARILDDIRAVRTAAKLDPEVDLAL
jgi:hypothetical protein